jgi:3',5'-cyclic AMP phosphodiesterase CpdA
MMNDRIGQWKDAAGKTAEPGQESISADGVDRRGFLKCMAWAGTGLVWTFAGGIPVSHAFGGPKHGNRQADFSFVQISDSHIGFNKPANTDVTATLQAALDRISAETVAPDFLIHTGDLTHGSKAAEFDTLDQVLTATKRQVFYVPGEHDTSVDDGKLYLDRYGKGSKGNGWYSFDHKGVHFIGLVNVVQLEGMGKLGQPQLDWLRQDLAGLKSSTPIVVFAHIPLWSVYPEWGWGTDDSAQALSYLKRFGSVSVLNGHIHQVMQKVEGHVTFHTAMSTAFPQPAPGSAPSPGPMKVEADRLKKVLGLSRMSFQGVNHPIAITDVPLEEAMKAAAADQVVVGVS